jgi:hypothetical protein
MNDAVLFNEHALAFFNRLSATLAIELTTPAQPVGGLLNLAASPEARITSLRLNASVFDYDTEERRPLTESELDTVVFKGGEIRMRGESELIISHLAPDCHSFTIRDLLAAVEATELRSRSSTEWLGGVDVHHIYFEGIHLDVDGIWNIYWGS